MRTIQKHLKKKIVFFFLDAGERPESLRRFDPCAIREGVHTLRWARKNNFRLQKRIYSKSVGFNQADPEFSVFIHLSPHNSGGAVPPHEMEGICRALVEFGKTYKKDFQLSIYRISGAEGNPEGAGPQARFIKF